MPANKNNPNRLYRSYEPKQNRGEFIERAPSRAPGDDDTYIVVGFLSIIALDELMDIGRVLGEGRE